MEPLYIYTPVGENLTTDSLVQALVVDDDITLRHMLVLQLDKLGVKADSAANGVEALRRIRSWNYELIIMDLQMPEMDGLQATAAIRIYEREQNHKPVPIIALTAGGPDKEICISVGMNDVVQKPLSLDGLGKIIERWLRKVC